MKLIFNTIVWFLQSDAYFAQEILQSADEPSSILDWVNLAASAASVIGLFLTLFILYQTFKLRDRYLFLIRAPQLVTQLEEHRVNINRYLILPDIYKQELRIELTECRANLKNLKPKLDRRTRRSLMTLDKRIKSILHQDPMSNDDAWAL